MAFRNYNGKSNVFSLGLLPFLKDESQLVEGQLIGF